MDEPKVNFSKWRKWKYRERLCDGRGPLFDVPDNYGILGVYLLASPMPSNQEPYHLTPEIFYIGMSSNITRRLDKSHEAVCQYREEFGDDSINKLTTVRLKVNKEVGLNLRL